MKHGPLYYDDFWPDRHRQECAHGNWKKCAECDAEGERATADLVRPHYWRGLWTGVAYGAMLVIIIDLMTTLFL